MILRRRFGGRWRSGGLKKKGTVERGTKPDQTGPGLCRLPALQHRTGIRVETGARRKGEGGRGGLAQKVEQESWEKFPRTDQGPTAVSSPPLPKPLVASLPLPSFFHSIWPFRSLLDSLLPARLFLLSPPRPPPSRPSLRSSARLGLAECPHLRATKRDARWSRGGPERERERGRWH